MSKKSSIHHIDGVYVMLGIILAASSFQLWYTVTGLEIIFGSNSQVAAETVEASPTPLPEVLQQETVRGADAVEGNDFYPTRIIMPTVGINLSITSVPLENGTWEVFDKVANYAEETSLVNVHQGNVGIYGHDRKAAFAAVKKLTIGETFSVETKEGVTATYEVADSYQTKPESVNEFFPTEDPIMTLVTCDGTASQYRYIVKARLIEVAPKKAQS